MRTKYKKNDTTRFILPMLYHVDFKDNHLFKYNDKFFITNNFINSYIGDVKKPASTYYIYLVYSLEKSYEFDYMEEHMIEHPYYIDDYTYGSDHVIYVFRVPNEYLVDYFLIKNSHYSKVSDKHKDRILNFWRLEGINLIYSILFKTDMILEYLSNKQPNLQLGYVKRSVKDLLPDEYWYAFTYKTEFYNYDSFVKDR